MPSIILSVGGGMFARSRAVEKRSIRLPNWWLTWGGRGGGRGGKGRNRVRRNKEGMSTGEREEKEGRQKGQGKGWKEGVHGWAVFIKVASKANATPCCTCSSRTGTGID